MTSLAAFANRGHRMEYFLCVEGFGWLYDEIAGPASGFMGTVFATNDFNGTLQSILDDGSLGPYVTVLRGLRRPGAVSDEIDQATLEYAQGGMEFSIVDKSKGCLQYFSPHIVSEHESALASALEYNSTTVVLTTDVFAQYSTAWLSSRELVLLGSKSGAAPNVTYSSCVRGMYGTPRGRIDTKHLSGTSAMAWDAGTVVASRYRVLQDRRVMLFAHAPGTAVADVLLLYVGRIQGLTSDWGGTVWSIKTCAEKFPGRSREIVTSSAWRLHTDAYVYRHGAVYGDEGALFGVYQQTGSSTENPPPR